MNQETSFWDASALVPICVQQMPSVRVRKLIRASSPVVWWATEVEVHSAISRLHREGAINAAEKIAATARLAVLGKNWKEILPDDTLRGLARNALDQYFLRAADSLQLAAALTWCRQHPDRRSFICGDKKLSVAAKDAGFTVIEIG